MASTLRPVLATEEECRGIGLTQKVSSLHLLGKITVKMVFLCILLERDIL